MCVCAFQTSETGLSSLRSVQCTASRPITLRTLLRLENILKKRKLLFFCLHINTGLFQLSYNMLCVGVNSSNLETQFLKKGRARKRESERRRVREDTSLSLCYSPSACLPLMCVTLVQPKKCFAKIAKKLFWLLSQLFLRQFCHITYIFGIHVSRAFQPMIISVFVLLWLDSLIVTTSPTLLQGAQSCFLVHRENTYSI